MENSTIVIRGAREHNLRNVNLELPRNRLIVFTGVSGSGKSSLAFDTLYAEGQRRYVESLSTYARQFLGQLQKPDVDYLGGLSPAISIQQKASGRNPRSTVGTITEIYDFLRVLYARIGLGHCPQCGRPITAQTREQIISRILALPEGQRFLVLAPVIRGQKGEYKDLFEEMVKRGFVRARVDGQVVRLTEDLKLDRRIKHDIAIVIDRLKIENRSSKPDFSFRSRLADSVEQALHLADGNLIIALEKEEKTAKPLPAKEKIPDTASDYQDILLSAHYACTHCDRSYQPPSPQLFSFNSPQGMCLECDGLGTRYSFDQDLLVPDPSLSFFDGAIPIVGRLRGMGRWRRHIFEGVAQTLGIDLKKPWRDLTEEHRQWLLYGSGDKHITFEWKLRGGGVWKHGGKWEGIIPQLVSSFKKTAAGPRRLQLEKYMRVLRCSTCQGQRLNAQARAVKVAGKTLVQATSMPIGELAEWFDPERGLLERSLEPVPKAIAAEVLKEIRGRLGFLLNVGLHYLTLERTAPTLSGGEAQRIRLAGQIGCGLVGVLYILDEPSIGLHPRDNDRLLRSLERLRDLGNTVIVVEHDEDTMRAADYLVDFGPGPGVRGGEIVGAGTFKDILAQPTSLTGQYLSGVREIAVPKKRRSISKKRLKIVGARHHNLKNINVEIPLGVFVAVTGVSGSGKSSLINDVLREALLASGRRDNSLASGRGQPVDDESPNSEEKNGASTPYARVVGEHDRITGIEHIDKVIDIDQSPIGRTPRSNPATYIKVFDEIRGLFAQLPEAKVRGYKPGRFSFNKPGGRCEACEGNGSNRLEMDFLADVWVTCPVCEGRRFNRETLQVHFKGKSIRDVLEMDVQEALDHFSNVPRIHDMLQTLHDVGLDYIKLGQPSPTLSGGEAQRIKLARELCRRSTGQTLYILDEPTTGLHFDDIQKLLQVLHGFVNAGNTVVVIEHNLDVIKTADWIIDLGPDGGDGGGHIVCTGTPETVADCKPSYTGQALQGVLQGKPRIRSRVQSPRPDNGRPEPIRFLTVQGAQQHNLKNISVSLPREQMTVCCGPSGSGKSSLALDTIYAEGQRRYIESLSSYARQFLGQVQKPKVESVSGLSPAISIEQKTTSKSPRSTVGTVTEIYDYLRILYARLGKPHCPVCQIPVGTQTADEIIEKIRARPDGTKLYLMAPMERRGQEKYQSLWEEIRRSGFVRMRVDGRSYNVEAPPSIDHRRKHQVEVIVDRIVVRAGQSRTRIADGVEAALDLGRGVLHVAHVDDTREEPDWKVERFSQHFACDRCGRSFEPLNPHHFSFNSPLGWCSTCEGLGFQQGVSVSLLIRDPKRSLREGAVAAWPPLTGENSFLPFAEALARFAGFSLDTPFEQLEPAAQRAILHGTGEAWIHLEERGLAIEDRESKIKKGARRRHHPYSYRFQYKGLFPAIDEASRISHPYRHKLAHLVSAVACTTCNGSRLRSDAAATRFFGFTLGEVCQWPLSETLGFFKKLKLTRDQQQVAGELFREITNRLQFLVDVGLDYLTLSRPTPTLSGGESQRIRLASQIGSGLTGVLYVLDEPTIGLHPRDNRRLLQALRHLRDLGNTLVVVEHDREVIGAADYLLDFGPGAGDRGGEITAQGSLKQILRAKSSLTGQFLSGRRSIPVPTNRRGTSGEGPRGSKGQGSPLTAGHAPLVLTVRGARHNNLKNIDVSFPLGTFIAVTGVSGSGKSSLIHEVLYNTLARKLHRARTPAAAHDDILGLKHIDKVINVDQDPIGNSPSSNPATYTGVFDLIRQLFAQLPEAKVRGYQPRRFSFNKPGGRCEACEGNGQKKIEMHFLPDVWVECDVCHGLRYNPETLAVQYKGKSIADVLKMRVSEALELFANIPKIRQVLQTLSDVGLDYLALGQPAPTLSGGESQRVKLAAELSRPNTGRTLYLLDEPTTGLHFDDIHKLLDVLNRLVELGNTVIVVEHNMDVIKTADWIIDLGPEAGDAGGYVVVQGTPEDIIRNSKIEKSAKGSPSPILELPPSFISHTAAVLGAVLAAGPHKERPKYDPHAAVVPREGDLALEAVGKDAQMPWQQDGRKWHTIDRFTSDGKRCRWEGEILTWLDQRIHELGPFSATDWSQRTIIEIAAPQKSQGWFLHAMTGQEWLLRLVFRVGRNTFKNTDLDARLKIPPLNETPGLEVYGAEPRVWVTKHKGPWESVTVLVHRLSEIDTPGFREFLVQAVAAFQQNLKRLQTKPEDVMPWKVNGERWHLSDKGFPVGRKIQWDRALLPRLLALVREVEPNLEIRWDSRDALALKIPGITRSWAQWRTKESIGLNCRFLGKTGQFNLSQVEKFGVSPSINSSRTDGAVLQLVFQHPDHVHPAALKELLTEHLRGFREVFGKADS
ncbi:MAG TPA: excinuclease ABC subunit UvrA [Gemmataceae bacterium]|nr:excinuclease ABC subunit UvrA [Gemmataceae bacterium]